MKGRTPNKPQPNTTAAAPSATQSRTRDDRAAGRRSLLVLAADWVMRTVLSGREGLKDAGMRAWIRQRLGPSRCPDRLNVMPCRRPLSWLISTGDDHTFVVFVAMLKKDLGILRGC